MITTVVPKAGFYQTHKHSTPTSSACQTTLQYKTVCNKSTHLRRFFNSSTSFSSFLIRAFSRTYTRICSISSLCSPARRDAKFGCHVLRSFILSGPTPYKTKEGLRSYCSQREITGSRDILFLMRQLYTAVGFTPRSFASSASVLTPVSILNLSKIFSTSTSHPVIFVLIKNT